MESINDSAETEILGRRIMMITASFIPLWAASSLGFVSLFVWKKTKPAGFFMESLLVFSCIALLPGFYFQPHYFILLFPVVSLGVGAWFLSMNRPLGL